ncbi:radical SAM protein [Streptomyces sp. NPDC051183]|uniref:radical SAM protein n=1 Tax=Streptomyces sp. NPDC051183 TaxID=3155165 RepID=UPI003441976C
MTITLSPYDAPVVDWTALRNFNALRGQARISLTPRCDLACFFCHNEGDTPPPLTKKDRTQQPRPRELAATDYITIIGALADRGMDRFYFTGGEPLTSPMARPVLSGLPPLGPDGSYTLITNGTHVRQHQPWLAKTRLDKVKVSLHYFSDGTFRTIAQARFEIALVLDGIEAAREVFKEVGLNCLLLTTNAHEVRGILDFALNRRMPVQFIELVNTDFNAGIVGNAVSADDVIRHLRTLTTDERIEVAGVGQGRRVFNVDGVKIDVIHRDLGRHHVGHCGTCPLRSKCVEGFWSLRVDHGGGLQPCLLREDLRLDLKDHLTDPEYLAEVVAKHVTAFTEGTL